MTLDITPTPRAMVDPMPRLFAACTVIAISCTGCDPPVQTMAPAVSKSPRDVPAEVAAPIASASATPPPAITQTPPPIPSTASGPAYVLVDHAGVLQITDGGAITVFPVPKDNSSLFTEIELSPTGHLWLSDFQGIRVRTPQGNISTPRSVKDGPLYEKLVIRNDQDAWAASSDSEWNIVHYDGRGWRTVRRRNQFPGKFSDNKLSSLAVTSDAVWVSSWNGLWRGMGETWENIPLPGGIGTGPHLLVYRDQIIVAGPSGVFLRKKAIWNKLAWPDRILLRWAVSDLGVFAAPSLGKPRIMIGSVEGENPTVESDPVVGRDIRHLAIDGSGRIWVGTDQALAVLDRKGHVLVQWSAGTLDGLTGSILEIAVVGAGPANLPAPKAGRTWDVIGRFVTYKSSSALSGTAISLCTSGASDCAKDPRAKNVTTDATGAFRFSAVPEGQFWIHMGALPGISDCETPFTVTGKSLIPARDCHEAPGKPGVCDLGTLTTCFPFEMPPPPHRK